MSPTPESTLQNSAASPAPPEPILFTEELNRRPSRAPDYATENRALLTLTLALADFPDTILQTLAEKILEVLHVGSAGVSLLTEDAENFFWPAIAGEWRCHIGRGSPRAFSPSGDVLDCNAPLLFKRMARRYPYFEAVTPSVEECLLVPFFIRGKAVGTIWAIAHDSLHKFDAEDLRLLENLGRFASAAYQAQAIGARQRRDATAKLNDAILSSRVTDGRHAEIQVSEQALLESQRFMHSSLDALSGHIAVLDQAATILEVNEGWRRFADQNRCTLACYGVGANYLHYCRQVFPEADNGQICALGIDDVINGRRAYFELEYPCHSPTEQRWFVMRVTRFQSAGPVRIVIVHDLCTERKHAEITLRASEEFNRSIIKSSPDCIKVLDLNGNLLSMLSGQALLGIEDIRPFLNKTWVNFWHGDDRVAAGVAIASAAAGITGNFVGFFRTPQGNSKWWDVAISPILGANGKPERLLSVSRDITQRKRAEMNLAFLAAVSHDLMLWTSVDEMICTVGAKIAEHFDLSVCAFAEIDETAEQVVITHDWHRDDVPGLVGTYRLGDFVEEEFIRVARTGEAIVVSDTTSDPRTTSEKFAALQIKSFVCVPLNRDGQWRFALCLYHSQPCDWRDDEIELARELTARIWTRLERLRAEAALRTSEEQYRNLFNSIDEGLCVIEMIFDEQDNPVDYRFIEVNPSFSKHTGMGDTIGKRVRELVPDIESYWIELYGKVVTTGAPVRYTNTVKGLNDRWLDVFAFRLGGPGSQKVAVLFTDITERATTAEALRRSEARFRALFDRGPIAMYSCDASGKTLEFNRVAVSLWGVEPTLSDNDEWFRGLFKFFLPDGTPLSHAETPMAQVLKGTLPAVHDMEIAFERPDATRVTVVTNIVPLKNERGEITGAINCFYDITERSALEQKTHQQAEMLADLNRRKDEFLAMLSHELRNPLAPISNAVQLLRLQKNEDPIQQQARRVIERQVGQLTHLIDDLMEVSRLTTGRIHLHQERLALAGIVEHAVETVRPLIDRHRHSLALFLQPEPIWLHADAARLEQVIVNLLTNAAKYTERCGSIWLTIAQEGNEAVLRVKDTGVGISSALLPRIFDLFTQADRTLDRSQGGLGIGLCLVQRLVEMHRGTVTVNSTLGEGSEFVVRLPALQNLALSPFSSQSKIRADGQDLRVLVVEDSPDAAATLTMLLELSGHDVQTTHDGLSAITAALKYRPHVVLLDIGLPGLNGFEVAKRLRQQPSMQNVVLVAMTGYGELTARQRSREAGFDHHLVKPADFRKVQEILVSVSAKATS